jgi:hypothetical protein
MASWQKWKDGSHVLLDDGRVICRVRRDPDYSRRWVIVPGGQRKPDPTPFPSLEKAKIVAESWYLATECRECLMTFEPGELTDGVCDECAREECPECEGTGLNPDPSDDDEGSSDCDYCGGDGVV